ncbi:MAG: 3-octaprenyl-4-hydroxybenzoate carboxy-lyase UbiX [Nitrospirae bacterium]|nr:MAG: 3-octaprenyl-4-hydroxybenzoate carboxy-lyase UbiX [Nitrospirota bacterium]
MGRCSKGFGKIEMKRFVFAISGASGPIIGIRILRELLKTSQVHLIISSQSFSIIKEETGIDWTIKKGSRGQRGKGSKLTEDKIRKHFKTDRLFFHEDTDMYAPIASGSFKTDGMLVVPCSMKTLSGIANGYANNLVERAADVTIKEGRALLLSPREMPFSAIHLENMLKLAMIGVKIAPPVPAFYHKPRNIDDIVDFMAGKILDAMGIEHEIFKRWGGK